MVGGTGVEDGVGVGAGAYVGVGVCAGADVGVGVKTGEESGADVGVDAAAEAAVGAGAEVRAGVGCPSLQETNTSASTASEATEIAVRKYMFLIIGTGSSPSCPRCRQHGTILPFFGEP